MKIKDRVAPKVSSLGTLRALLRLMPLSPWSTPVMIALGVLTSAAETLGISLVVLFLYSAMGQPNVAEVMGGGLGGVMRHLHGIGGAALAGLVFVLIVARGLLSLVYRLISARMSNDISEAARNGLHKQLLTVSYGFVRRHEQAALLDLLATESWSVATAHASFMRLVISLCSISVFGAFLLMLSWQITVATVLAGLIVGMTFGALNGSARKLGLKVKQTNEDLAWQILVTLQGMRTIRVFGQEKIHHDRFEKISAEAKSIATRLEETFGVLTPATEMANLAILCAIVGGGQYLHIGFPTVLAAVALLYRLQPHVREAQDSVMRLSELQPQLEAVRSMLVSSDKTYPAQGSLPAPPFSHEIRFEGVDFEYEADRAPILRNVSFSIPAGKVTALVGASGAGKTTIVNLLLRLYEPRHGRILVDGVDLREIRRADWLSTIAAAGQDIELVEGTVEENLLLVDRETDRKKLDRVIADVGLTEVIANLPGRYDEWIGQGGANLSGGQRQRVGLARALMRDADFLILDEATNALDEALDAEVRQRIRRRFEGRTILLITHKLETVLGADHVVCLEDGGVLTEGPPRELLRDSRTILSTLQMPN